MDQCLGEPSVTARTYRGAGHPFSAFGFPNYDEAGDRDSWSALSAFLDDVSG